MEKGQRIRAWARCAVAQHATATHYNSIALVWLERSLRSGTGTLPTGGGLKIWQADIEYTNRINMRINGIHIIHASTKNRIKSVSTASETANARVSPSRHASSLGLLAGRPAPDVVRSTRRRRLRVARLLAAARASRPSKWPPATSDEKAVAPLVAPLERCEPGICRFSRETSAL